MKAKDKKKSKKKSTIIGKTCGSCGKGKLRDVDPSWFMVKCEKCGSEQYK